MRIDVPRASRSASALRWIATTAILIGSWARAANAAEPLRRPTITKLGTIDLDLVEATPVVSGDRLLRLEYVRAGYYANKSGESYFRFVDTATGQATPVFAKGWHLGCAFAEGRTMYAFGVDKWGGSRIRMFRSTDLKHWESRLALELPKWELFNTSVCKSDGRYVMAIEAGDPAEIVGVPFTMFFADSSDLQHWKLLPLDRVYSKEKYTACPALRCFERQYYLICLKAQARADLRVARRSLQGPGALAIEPAQSRVKFSPEDKRIANPKLTQAQRRMIAGAVDINNSDIDLCEYGGKTVIYYSWGNQQGREFLAEARYDGGLAGFLKGFFP